MNHATDGGDVPADVVAGLEMTPRHVTRSRYCDVPYHSMLPDDERDDESAPGDDESAPGDGDGSDGSDGCPASFPVVPVEGPASNASTPNASSSACVAS